MLQTAQQTALHTTLHTSITGARDAAGRGLGAAGVPVHPMGLGLLQYSVCY